MKYCEFGTWCQCCETFFFVTRWTNKLECSTLEFFSAGLLFTSKTRQPTHDSRVGSSSTYNYMFSDICAKRHLRERHLREVASTCLELVLPVMSHLWWWLMTGRTSFWLTELRGEGTKLGEGKGTKVGGGKGT
jgi:hypothetical protein